MKRIKLLVIMTLLCTFVHNNVFGQMADIYFSKKYTDTALIIRNNYLSQLVYDSSTNSIYTLLSSFNNYTPSDPRPKKFTSILQTDLNGDIINEYKDTFPEDFEFEYIDIISTDSFIYCTGYMNDTNYRVDTWQSKTIVIKLDKNLNKKWRIEIANVEWKQCTPYNIFELKNKEILLSYRLITETTNPIFPIRGCVLAMSKIDPSGFILWDSIYDLNYTSGIISGYADNGNLILSGMTSEWGASNDAYMYRLDSAGNELWYKVYEPSRELSLITVHRTKDIEENYFSVGTVVFYYGGVGRGYINKVNSEGNIIWNKHIGSDTINQSLNDGVVSRDGGVVGIGSSKFDNLYPLKDRGWIYKLDADGNELWSRKITQTSLSNSDEYLHDIIELPDGSFIITGSTNDIDSIRDRRVQYGWMIRVDEYGCMVPDCHLTSIENFNYYGNVSIFPNPTKDGKFTIDLTNIEIKVGIEILILDVNGKIIENIPMNNSIKYISVDLSTYVNGIYFVKIYHSSGEYLYKLIKT